jgi:sorbitol-specific phosphotransferase system component IIBC
MSDPMLFPFLDTAVRVIAILVLCAIPLLIPLPSPGRASHRISRAAQKRALTSD